RDTRAAVAFLLKASEAPVSEELAYSDDLTPDWHWHLVPDLLEKGERDGSRRSSSGWRQSTFPGDWSFGTRRRIARAVSASVSADVVTRPARRTDFSAAASRSNSAATSALDSM